MMWIPKLQASCNVKSGAWVICDNSFALTKKVWSCDSRLTRRSVVVVFRRGCVPRSDGINAIDASVVAALAWVCCDAISMPVALVQHFVNAVLR